MPRKKKTEPALVISEISEIARPNSEISEEEDPRLKKIEELLALSDSETERKVVEKPKRKPRAKKVKEVIPTLHVNPHSESMYVLVPAGMIPKLKIETNEPVALLEYDGELD
jgi:hypothetical protein